MIENQITIVLIAISVLAVSITVHEFMHSYVSNLLGDSTARLSGRMTLNPIKHVDPFLTILLPIVLLLAGVPPFGAAKPVPVNPARLKYDEYGSALVAVAGPASNMLMAIIGGAILKFIPIDVTLWSAWWGIFVMINIGFFLFNMIPFPPLDGSRILYAFAPDVVRNFMMQIERMGLISILFFMLLIYPVIRDSLSVAYGWLIDLVTGL